MPMSKEMTMSKKRRTSRIVFAALVAALTGVAGRAEAACDAAGNAVGGGPCYHLKGSDTLFDVMTEAIRQARNCYQYYGAGYCPPGLAWDLFYEGTGSGNGERQLIKATASGIGVQSLAPMSRNFRPAIIDPLSPDFVAHTAANPTAIGHAAWGGIVVGLDAVVFVVKGGTALDDLDFPTFTDGSVPTPFKKAVTNNAALATAFGDSGAFNNVASTKNYSNIMSVVLSGVDGSGTIPACADPRRVQAIQDLSGLLGVSTLNHFFRSDDNSGTTDTIKDRIMVVPNRGEIATRYLWTGGRFCSGTARGGTLNMAHGALPQLGLCSVARTTTCTVDANCPTGEKCWFNLNNQDFDPIRRPCTPADASRAPTSCTDMTTGRPCQASDGNANCTQGLIVALTDADPGSTDVTVSIGKRVGLSAGDVMGYGGREAAAQPGAKSLAINTVRAFDARVRDSLYLLARRLFIQNSYSPYDNLDDTPTCDQTNLGVTGGGADQRTKEQDLWGHFLSNSLFMDPIIRQFNFIRCASTADGDYPCNESNNLCCIWPTAPTPDPLRDLAPYGTVGGKCSNNSECFVGTSCGDGSTCPAYNYGGAKSIDSQGRVWNGTTATQLSCSGSGGSCITGMCPSGGVCPLANGRPANAPCTLDSDCASNVCADTQSHSTGGKDGLYCQ